MVNITHDPIFSVFRRFEGEIPVGFTVDFLGGIRRERLPLSIELPAGGGVVQATGVMPLPDEEYFEWIDLLESARAASGSFTMLELGAGWGRWGVAGVLAARQCGIDTIRIGLVEAEPIHVELMRVYLSDNQIPSDIVDIFEGVISEDPGEAYFLVRKSVTSKVESDGGYEWWGQSKLPADSQPVAVAKGAYANRDLLIFGNGRAAVVVPQFQASKLIRKYPLIDLIDMDLQGEEFVVIYGAMEALNDRAKRLHIGTHSPEIERDLRALLAANKWECLRDYGCLKTNATPYGEHYFQDGVQTWINRSE